MKFILISSTSIQHRYVIKQLIEVLQGDVAGIILESGKSNDSLVTLIRKTIGRYDLATFIERLITKLTRKLVRYEHKSQEAKNNILGNVPSIENICHGFQVHHCNSANETDSVQFVREVSPDYILVYGTKIIHSKTLDLARRYSLNLHTGIAPDYRGSASAFWALYENNPTMIGSTIHECTNKLDGGNIFLRACVRLDEQDSEHEAFARSVKSGALHYAYIARKLADEETISTTKQNLKKGKEYKFTDKTFIKELQLLLLFKRGVLANRIKRAKASELPFPPVVCSQLNDHDR